MTLLFIGGCASVEKAHIEEKDTRLERVFEPKDRIVERSGSIELRVSDLDIAQTEVAQIIEEAGGYIQNTRVIEDSSVRLLVRVPQTELDSTMDRISELGTVGSRTVSSEDVTGEQIDLETRLKNSIILRDRLIKLLEKASTVEEILSVEKELARVQSEIESMQARLERLQNRVELSRLTVNLKRKRILGPLGYIGYGLWWVVEKLFVIK